MKNFNDINKDNNLFNREEKIKSIFKKYIEELNKDKININPQLNKDNDNEEKIIQNIQTKILTEFDIGKITKDQIDFYINNKVKMNTLNLNIVKEILLYEKISEIYRNNNIEIDLIELLNKINIIRPKFAKDIYYAKRNKGIFFELYSNEVKAPFVKEQNEMRLNYVKNMILIRKFL